MKQKQQQKTTEARRATASVAFVATAVVYLRLLGLGAVAVTSVVCKSFALSSLLN